MRVLYILRGLVPPPKQAPSDRFFSFPETLEGDVLLPVWWSAPEQVRAELGADSWPVHAVKHFRYHLFLAAPFQGIRQRLAMFAFYVRTGRRLHRERRFDCIVTAGHSLTALAGAVLKFLTGARLIVELIGTPAAAYRFEGSSRPVAKWFKKLYSDTLLHLTVLSADRVKLLYPGQLRGYPLLDRVPASVFHEFVTLSQVRPDGPSEDFVLFVGHPWYLKGVDVLIRAFRAIAAEFPHVRLKLLGYFPDRAPLDALARGCPQIEFLAARPNPETLRIVERAMILALPSRTEAMGRVLLEAMGARKPVVASDIDGIPHYVRDGYNGLLCRVGDVDDLAGKLRRLLSDAALRERLAANGFELARTKFDESAYAREFERMLTVTLGA